MAATEQQENGGKRNRILMNLFGLPFLLVGLGVLIGGPLETLWQHWQSQDWQAVPAQLDHLELESHAGDDSTTYSISASYRYRYQGREYYGTRVGYDWGSDNVGNYHSRTVSQLRTDQARGQLRAWVNPDAPQESYLSRELRWKKLLFGVIFGLIFAVAGAAVMLMPRLKARAQPTVTGEAVQIDSNERRGYWLWVFMSFMFIGISSPVMLAIPDEINKGNWAVLIALIFPVAGVWMGFMAWKQRRLWQHFGPTPLMLEPAPGQLGGDVAGTVVLAHYQSDASYRFTLQCLKITVTGSGKNRSRSEHLLWEDQQYAHVEARGQGIGLRFLYTPPETLPVTQSKGRVSHEWRLLLSGPTEPMELERSWSVPVAKGGLKGRPLPAGHVRDNERREQIEAVTALSDQIDMQPLPDGVKLISAAGRHKGMTVMLVLMGVVFTASTAFLFQQAAREGLMLYVMAFFFGLFGVPMLIGGLFTAGRSLESRVESGQVTMVRSWGGMRLWQRQSALSRADQLSLKDGGSINQGHKHTRYYHVICKGADGRELRLAEGIAGQEAAEALQNELIRMLRLP